MAYGGGVVEPAAYAPPILAFAPQATLAPAAATPSSGLAVPDAPDEAGTVAGPDPYVDYARRYTEADGIAFTYKTIDENAWRTAGRVLVLLFVVTIAFAYQVDASPYPMLPRGCRPFGPCRVPVPADHLAVNLALQAGFALLCGWILFVEVQVYRELEILSDCMILDGRQVFWASRFELGLPQFTAGDDGMQILAGVYGTRYTEFLKLKAFDENDRGPAVFAAHLAAAMQQQWAPATKSGGQGRRKRKR